MSRTTRAALIAAALWTAATPASAGVAESWYLSRGRANARIGNHAAAIEAYRKALEANPRSREASRELGLELLRNGETDPAVAAFDRHLARFPDDRDVAFEQARILQWSRYAYRARDAVRYLRMGLAGGDDPVRRRELARLLGRDRATLDEALREYDRLLAGSPADEALRDERLRLLLWDPRRRPQAIAELERREADGRADERARRDLARLLADDPARAGEAAERYRSLLERNPADAELRLGRARALARAGRRADAREAYVHALALRQPPEARIEYADLLAADPATRGDAAPEYEAALREAPRSRRARLALARVLAADRDTSRASIPQYEAVLASAPDDAAAHAGLARAHAWTGDPDRALAHARQAGAPAADLARELRRGREPALGGGARALAQPRGDYRLSSVQAFASGSADPSPFTSSAVEGGLSTHRGASGRAEGSFVAARGEWRPAPGTRLGGALGYDGALPSAAALSGELTLGRRAEGRDRSLTLSRVPRRDSFRALAGEEIGGRTVGAASEQALEARAGWAGPDGRVTLSARAGVVTGLGMPSTLVAGAGARAERTVLRASGWTVRAGGSVDVTHHARDLSAEGGDAAPRLFSPPLFAAASPRIVLSREAGLRGEIVAEAGPALQLVRGAETSLRAGGDGRVAVSHRWGDRLRLSAELRGEKIGDVYTRVEGGAAIALLF